MSLLQQTGVLLLFILTIGVCHIYYLLYFADSVEDLKPPSFLRINIIPVAVLPTVSSANTNPPETVSNVTTNPLKTVFKSTINAIETGGANIVNQGAVDISVKIHDHESALAKQGLLPNYKHGEEWYKPLDKVDYGDGTCDLGKKRGQYKDLMEKWKNISETYKIPSFLYAGTLIGAARNSDSIPWDGDMDVLVDGRFNEVVAAIANKRNFDRYDGQFHLVIQEDFRQPVPEGIKMGKKLYYTAHRKRFNCKGQEVPTQKDNCAFQEPFGRLIKGGRHLDLWDYHYKDDIIYTSSNYKFPLTLSFPLKKCMFLDMEMLCPKQPIDFLKIIYGTNVMTPKWRCNNTKWIQ